MAKSTPKVIPTTQRVNLGTLANSIGNMIKRIDNSIPCYNSKLGGFKKGAKYYQPANKSGTKYLCYSADANRIRRKINRQLEDIQVSLVQLETKLDVCKEDKSSSKKAAPKRRTAAKKKPASKKKTSSRKRRPRALR